MTIFNRPYFARSISEFWKRWHISLSTWFKDYLYISLGGNRVSAPRWYLNLFIVFLVSGIWHGASWTYVVWGALHGFYMVAGLMTGGLRGRAWAALGLARFPVLTRVLSAAGTFSLVTFAWVFFRADDVAQAWDIVTRALAWLGNAALGLAHGRWEGAALGMNPFDLGLGLAGIL